MPDGNCRLSLPCSRKERTISPTPSLFRASLFGQRNVKFESCSLFGFIISHFFAHFKRFIKFWLFPRIVLCFSKNFPKCDIRYYISAPEEKISTKNVERKNFPAQPKKTRTAISQSGLLKNIQKKRSLVGASSISTGTPSASERKAASMTERERMSCACVTICFSLPSIAATKFR